MTMKSAVAGVALLAGTTFVGSAQAQYAPYPYYPAYPGYQPYAYAAVPAAPPSWSYDPYTSGLGPCPQRRPGDPPCNEMIFPTYGQPSFWPVR